ncbi:MAG: hypothetical protein JO227_14505, partial [Acetobacteraceae bacterium]|nr:hypothetical protein [Acetobacteraceae bacterium]
MPLTIPSSIGEITGIRRTVVGVLAAGLISAAFAPSWFWALLVGVVLAGITALAYRHLPAVCAAWTLVAGCTLEITLADLVGPAAFQPTIAVVKGAGIILAMMAIARFGFRPDVFNPASAFTVMFAGGLAHGLHPELSLTDSLRSLIGSVAPFAFSFSRLSPGWSAWIIRTAPWIPVVGVAAALVLQLFGLRPMFVDSGGLRLTGLGHPAFLAGACLVGIYASLIMLFRDGRRTHVTMLALNFLLLVLTGARAPLFYAVAVTGLSLALVRSPNWPIRSRVCIVLPLLVALPWLLPVAEGGTEVRALSLTLSDPGNLSGRDLLWP